jgi:hypothetical protein
MGNATLPLLPASPTQTLATPEQYNALVNAITGNQIMRDPTTGMETDGAYDLGDVSNGRPRNLNITGDLIKNGQVINVGVPIGGIIPWHKSMPSVPALPDNYAECDGSNISDIRSPMYGYALPSLNASGRFIRGGTTSGTTQSDQIKSHTHGLDAGGLYYALKNQAPNTGINNVMAGSTLTNVGAGMANVPVTASPAGSPDETRPINISMVWVMRIF